MGYIFVISQWFYKITFIIKAVKKYCSQNSSALPLATYVIVSSTCTEYFRLFKIITVLGIRAEYAIASWKLLRTSTTENKNWFFTQTTYLMN